MLFCFLINENNDKDLDSENLEYPFDKEFIFKFKNSKFYEKNENKIVKVLTNYTDIICKNVIIY